MGGGGGRNRERERDVGGGGGNREGERGLGCTFSHSYSTTIKGIRITILPRNGARSGPKSRALFSAHISHIFMYLQFYNIASTLA